MRGTRTAVTHTHFIRGLTASGRPFKVLKMCDEETAFEWSGFGGTEGEGTYFQQTGWALDMLFL